MCTHVLTPRLRVGTSPRATVRISSWSLRRRSVICYPGVTVQQAFDWVLRTCTRHHFHGEISTYLGRVSLVRVRATIVLVAVLSRCVRKNLVRLPRSDPHRSSGQRSLHAAVVNLLTRALGANECNRNCWARWKPWHRRMSGRGFSLVTAFHDHQCPPEGPDREQAPARHSAVQVTRLCPTISARFISSGLQSRLLSRRSNGRGHDNCRDRQFRPVGYHARIT